MEREHPAALKSSGKFDPTRFPQHKYSAAKVISSLFLKPTDKIWLDDVNTPAERKEYVLYLGCNVLQTPALMLTCINVLKRMGVDFAIVGGMDTCCGHPHLSAGKIEAAESFDRRRIRFFEKFQPRAVIEWDESCYEFTHHNTVHYLKPSFEMKNIEQFIADNMDRVPLLKSNSEKVTIHDHYGYGGTDVADFDAPRRVLAALPGIEIVEMTHHRGDALRCGYEALAFKGSRDEADAANRRLLDEAKSSGADALAVFWQACYRTLIPSEISHGIHTKHFIQLLAESMGIACEDKYRTYKLSGNLEYILKDAEENIVANGYTVNEIRPYVQKYMFGITSSFC